jgi:hypothetical protein
MNKHRTFPLSTLNALEEKKVRQKDREILLHVPRRSRYDSNKARMSTRAQMRQVPSQHMAQAVGDGLYRSPLYEAPPHLASRPLLLR